MQLYKHTSTEATPVSVVDELLSAIDSEGSSLTAVVERLPTGKTAERGETEPAGKREEQ